MNAYVTFLRRGPEEIVPSSTEDSSKTCDNTSVSGSSVHTASHSMGETSSSTEGSTAPAGTSGDIGLICVSGVADFEAVKTWCEVVAEVCPFASFSEFPEISD